MTPRPSSSDPVTELPHHAAADAGPDSWLAALGVLANSRIDLARLEGREAARQWGRKAVMLGAGAFALVVAWLLLVAGVVAAVAAAAGWQWYFVAMGAAGLHALAGFLCLKNGAARSTPTFPLTRQELAKDRQWLTNLSTRRK